MRPDAKSILKPGSVFVYLSVLISLALLGFLARDISKSRALLDDLRLMPVLGLAGLAVLDHGLRYWRWEVLLRRVAAVPLKRFLNVLSFCAGSLLIFTPARMGEVMKSAYVKDYVGIPMASTLPILASERMGDLLVMTFLASVGLILLGESAGLWAAGALIAGFSALFVLGLPVLVRWLKSRQIKFAVLGRLLQFLETANASRKVLLQPKMLFVNISIGVLAWMVEVSIFFLALSAAGADTNTHYFLVALAVFPLASLGGSLSLLPGGLGVTEGSLAALTVLFSDLSSESAILAALLARAAIFAVVLSSGFVSLALLRSHRSLPSDKRVLGCSAHCPKRQ